MRSRVRTVAVAAVLALGGVLVAPLAAHADDYPTWDDVLAARANEQNKQAEIDNLNALLQQLQANVEATKKDLEAKAKKWQQLDAQYQAKSAETKTLKAQADQAEQVAVESEQRAGEWAASVVRIGGTDPTLSLFTAPDNADEILGAIGVSSRVSAQANALYEQAVQQRNTAQSLTDQAAVMEQELQELDAQAKAAMDEAQKASEAATKAVLEQQQHQAELQAQLDVLTKNREATEADYQIGEQKRLEEQLASIGVDWGQISPSGWIRPTGGFVSAGFGWDDDHYYGQGEFHEGVDLATSCWTPIVAAHSGVVEVAGWYGGFGNAVIIDHGGGLETLYGHQPDGGIQVGVGQWVETGQLIGYVGSTGMSTGCHLHFGVYANGSAIDPTPFMAANGVYF